MIQLDFDTSYQVANTLLRDVFDAVAPAGTVGGRITPKGIVRHERCSSVLEDFRLSYWLFADPADALAWG